MLYNDNSVLIKHSFIHSFIQCQITSVIILNTCGHLGTVALLLSSFLKEEIKAWTLAQGYRVQKWLSLDLNQAQNDPGASVLSTLPGFQLH